MARTLLMPALSALILLTLLGPGGCTGPLDRSEEEALRDSLLAAQRNHLQSLRQGQAVELQRPPSEVEQALPSRRIEQLDAVSGPEAYEDAPLPLTRGLLGGDEVEIVRISLQEAIEQAVRHNLDYQFAQISPAIAETRLLQAEAVFDATVFASVNWTNLDTPQPSGAIAGLAGDRQSQDLEVVTGIRKPLTTGGQASIETSVRRQEEEPTFFGVSSYYDADVLASLRQPLLRNFGQGVNLARVQLAASARNQEVQRLRQTLLELAFQVEQTYWRLLLAQQRVLIRQRLLERTLEDRNRLARRAEFDVSPVRLTEAASFVELRRADVVRARQTLRDLSDRLKRLINAPGLPVGTEVLVLPVDRPVDASVEFSLLEAVRTALRERPSLQAAMLEIKDASIRQRVADNARLPVLDLIASVGVSGLDVDSAGGAYEELGEMNYVDYILGGEFELPIGNRGPEAQFRQRQLERRAAAVDYRREVQNVILEIKQALRELATSYELIGVTRAARLANAENLRAIQEQEEAGVALTPEFLLDLKLNAQARLADAEEQEIQALTNYMTALAAFYQATGTLLEQDRIAFQAPEIED